MKSRMQEDPFWEALRRPSSVTALSEPQWDLLIRQARLAKVLGRLDFLLRDRELLDDLPPRVQNHLLTARVTAAKHESTMRWETRQVRRALAPTGVPVVLLKGAAYVAASLPPANGRLYVDIDIMVPKPELKLVERTLIENGWQSVKVDLYDQRYYRQWMHELPPLVHWRRGTTIDVHHTILPETGRLHPDPEKLLNAAEPLQEANLHVFAPIDMVLHSAAHLFQDGDLVGGIRDLTDLDDLFRHFADGPEFWDNLVSRAKELDLARPLYYALRYTHQFLETPIPEKVFADAKSGGPRWLGRTLMDTLVNRVLSPQHPDYLRQTDPAALALYVRSHWLRMPPRLLALHLARKAFSRWRSKPDDET